MPTSSRSPSLTQHHCGAHKDLYPANTGVFFPCAHAHTHKHPAHTLVLQMTASTPCSEGTSGYLCGQPPILGQAAICPHGISLGDMRKRGKEVHYAYFQ